MKRKKLAQTLSIGGIFGLLFSTPVSAAITDSPLFTGAEKLLEDVRTWLVGFSVLVGTLVIIYALIRRAAAADVADQVKYEKIAKIAVVCVILAVTIIGVLPTLLQYFGFSG